MEKFGKKNGGTSARNWPGRRSLPVRSTQRVCKKILPCGSCEYLTYNYKPCPRTEVVEVGKPTPLPLTPSLQLPASRNALITEPPPLSSQMEDFLLKGVCRRHRVPVPRILPDDEQHPVFASHQQHQRCSTPTRAGLSELQHPVGGTRTLQTTST